MHVQKVSAMAKPRLDLTRTAVQVSLDVTSIDEALRMADGAVRAGVDLSLIHI